MLSKQQKEELKSFARHTRLAARVVAGALLTWVPWTAIRFAVCWSIPLVLQGRLPDVFTDAPYFWLLLFPFLVELIVPVRYFVYAALDNKFDDPDLELCDEEAMIQHDILALRYRLMRPGIVTFVAHLVLMLFSPFSAIFLSPIPWALSFFWWDGRFPWYSMKPFEKDFMETRRFKRFHAAMWPNKNLGNGVLTGPESQAKLEELLQKALGR